MFNSKTRLVWIGIILLSGMFLMGQDSWVPPEPPSAVDIFTPPPGSNLGADAGSVSLSGLSGNICYTTDGSDPEYNDSCTGGTTAQYADSITVSCELADGGTVPKTVKIAFLFNGELIIREANYFILCNADPVNFTITGNGSLEGFNDAEPPAKFIDGDVAIAGTAVLDRISGEVTFNYNNAVEVYLWNNTGGFRTMKVSDVDTVVDGAFNGSWTELIMDDPTGWSRILSCEPSEGLGCGMIQGEDSFPLPPTDIGISSPSITFNLDPLGETYFQVDTESDGNVIHVDYVLTVPAPWPGTVQWGTAENDTLWDLTSASDNQLYAVGSSLNAGAGFAEGTITSLNSLGEILWEEKLLATGGATEGATVIFDVTTDLAGNVYVTGSSVGDIYGQTNSGGADVIVAKFSSAGTLQWAKLLGGASAAAEQGAGLAMNAATDKLIVTGYTADSASFQGETTEGSFDTFVVQLSDLDAAAPTIDWTAIIGTPQIDWGAEVRFNAVGNIIVAGLTLGNFGGGNLGNYDVFVAELLGADGSTQWLEQYGGNNLDWPLGTELDSSGNIYLSGLTTSDSFYGNANGQNAAGANTNDAYVMKVDGGTHEVLWARTIASSGNEQSFALALDSSSDVIIAVTTNDDIAGQAGGTDAVVAKWTSAGDPVWVKQTGSLGNDSAKSLIADIAGNIYLGGDTTGDLHGNTNLGGNDFFVLKYNAAGELQVP